MKRTFMASFGILVVAAFSPAGAEAAFIDINAGLTEVEGCDITWGDYDNDGDLDLASAGWIKSWPCVANICRNDGGGIFVESNSGLEPCQNCSLPWGDYDGDGDLDLAVAGVWYDGSNAWGTGDVFRNDGGAFSGIGAPVVPMRATCSLAWGDYDNDGDLDLALAGTGDDPYPPVSRIYRNDGGGTFVDVNAALTDVKECSLAWADYDNDGDLDLALAGDTDSVYLTAIYGNNGDGTFTDISAGLPGVTNASVAWGDYDNDGDFDLALTGHDGASPLSKVFRNDGGGTFADINAGLTAVSSSLHGVAWGDYDNDGDLDLAILGNDGSTWVSKLYRNDGGGTFTEIAAGLANCYLGTMAWGDYDSDGDLDLIVGGKTTFNPFNPVTRLYRNDSAVFNALPAAPTGLSTNVAGSDVRFMWNPSTDAETPQPGLSYNLRVGTAPGIDDVMSGAADTATGWRKIPATGNAQKMLSWIIKGLPDGTYYWSVQAVDTAFAGSSWAPEQTVTVGGPAVWHVTVGGSGDQSGVDWANAMAHPQDAMDMAAVGDEVWVAGGSYYDNDSDMVVLWMYDEVSVYGGFGAWETSRVQRDPKANVTTLDGVDTSYHVVWGAANLVLDGFTITRGNAAGSNPDDRGAGMFNGNSVSGLDVRNCTFSMNRAPGSAGGAVQNESCTVTFTNCVFFGNWAGFGGAVGNMSSILHFANCSFSGNNTPNDGGAMYNYMVGAASVANSVLWGDTAGRGPEIFNEGTGTCNVSFSDVGQIGGFTDDAGNVNVDPMFVDPANDDYRLMAGSLCIDTGDNLAVTEPTDLDGNPRIVDGDDDTIDVVDMGAYEYAPPSPGVWYVVVGGSGDMSGVDWANAMAHPQDAMDMAAPGEEIWVAEGTYWRRGGADTYVLRMWDGIAVYGGFQGWETDRGGAQPSTHVVTFDGEYVCEHVVQGAADCVLDGCTILNGNGDYGAGVYCDSVSYMYIGRCSFFGNTTNFDGAGIYSFSSSMDVQYCTFDSNDAVGYGGGIWYSGGSALYVYGSSFMYNTAGDSQGAISAGNCPDVEINSCSFYGNSAAMGGSGAVGIGDFASTTICYCNFDGNTAPTGLGGACSIAGSDVVVHDSEFNGNSATEGGALDFSNPTGMWDVYSCVFYENSAEGLSASRGGAVQVADSPATFTNCTFHGNTAVDRGGAICNYSGDCTVTNCILWGDSAPLGQEYHNYGGYSFTVSYSDVQGGGGSIDANPIFMDAANGDFRLHADSPCIDSADGWVAPTWDYGSNPRHDDPGMPNVGIGPISYVDMGAFEFQGDSSGNSAPIAIAIADQTSGPAPLAVIFEAGYSFDPDGTITSYEWDFGDTFTGAGVTVSHTYDTAGDYTAMLTVWDDASTSGTDLIAIQVTGPDSITVTDPMMGATWYLSQTRTITWSSSGSISDVSIDLSRDGGGSWEPIISSCPNSGSYDWTVAGATSTDCVMKVSDASDGLPWAMSGTFTVATPGNAPPTVSLSASPTSGTAPLSVSFDAGSWDPDGDGLTHEWDWDGDATYDQNTGSSSSVVHTFNTAGTYSVEVRVSDPTHSVYDWATITVSSGSNEPPGVNITTPSNGANVSGVVYVAANAWDNDGTVDRVEFYVDGGFEMTDGTGPYDYNWTSTAVSDGWHTITARAYDDDGAWTEHSISVNVQNGDMMPPGPVMNPQITNSAETTLLLEWMNPYDPDFWNVVVLRSASGQPDHVPTRGEDLFEGSSYGNGVCIYDGPGRDCLDVSLTANTEYYYAVYAYDYSRNYSSASYFSAWTTGLIAPWVEWTDPWNNEMNASLDIVVRVRFSEPMDEGVTEGVFIIQPYIHGSFWWEDHGRTLCFSPAGDFEADTWYWVQITNGGMDLSGIWAMSNYDFGFRTQLGEGVLGSGCGSAGAAAWLLAALAFVLRRSRRRST